MQTRFDVYHRVLRAKKPLCLAASFGFMFAALALSAPVPQTHRITASPTGLAWQVKGTWQENGKGAFLQNGDVVHPGVLLQPATLDVTHSITVLMPDGRRFFYECFKPEDCARGFRVPELVGRPAPLAVDFMAGVRKGLAFESRDALPAANTHPATAPLPRDESVSVIDADRQVHIGGLVSKMADGNYTCDLLPLDHAHPRQYRVPLQKSGPTIAVAVPSPGPYILTITDDLDTKRVDLFVAAVDAGDGPRIKKKFDDIKALLKDWNNDYQGWPVHELQRAYLESLIENVAPVKPAVHVQQAAAMVPSAPDDAKAGEPVFTPKAGLMKGTTAIKLICSTPGCTIRYTVDGSQPVAVSPVYASAITLMGTELTIKAYASAPGKKDSPVVTGVFLIEGSDPH